LGIGADIIGLGLGFTMFGVLWEVGEARGSMSGPLGFKVFGLEACVNGYYGEWVMHEFLWWTIGN